MDIRKLLSSLAQVSLAAGCAVLGPVTVSAQEALGTQGLKATPSSAENTYLRLAFRTCERNDLGMDCYLTATAKRKAVVRFSKLSYLMQKGGAHIPVTWVSIGGDGRNPAKYVSDYVVLEQDLSSDIILRFEGEIGELDALVTHFGAGGTSVFRFVSQTK